MTNRAGRFMLKAGGAWYIRWPLRILILALLVWLATRPYPRTAGGTVRVVPAQQAGVRAQISDEIVDIKVREGDLVQAGDVIATLSGREVHSDINTTEARLKQSDANLEELVNGPLPVEISILEHEVAENKVNLDFYDLEVKRLEGLVKESVANQRELDQRRADRDATREKLANAQERLERLRIGSREETIAAQRAQSEQYKALLDYYHIQEGLLVLRSPITGRVATPYVRNRVGQRVDKGDLVCIIESEDLAIEMEADEAAAAEVREGMPVEVRFHGLEREGLKGHVASLSHAIETEDEKEDASVRTDPERLIQRTRVTPRVNEDYYLRVTIALDDAPPTLTNGMTGYAKIKVGDSVVWRSFLERISRFFHLEAWSWIP